MSNTAAANSIIELPWTIVPRTLADLLTLEEAIRTLLECESTSCALLQSNEYARLKIELRHLMNGWTGALPLLSQSLCDARPLCALNHAVALYASRVFGTSDIMLVLRARELALELDPSPGDNDEEEEPFFEPKRRCKRGQPSLDQRFHGLEAFEAQLLARRGKAFITTRRAGGPAPPRARK
jgi:hypothetical protein